MRLQHLLLAIVAAVATTHMPVAIAADAIKIGFPMPLSGPASVYGVPIGSNSLVGVRVFSGDVHIDDSVIRGFTGSPGAGSSPRKMTVAV